MTDTTTTTPARENSTGNIMPCPCCGEAEATILLNLADTADFRCQECEAEFTREDVDRLIRKWGRLLLWIDAMPALDQDGE